MDNQTKPITLLKRLGILLSILTIFYFILYHYVTPDKRNEFWTNITPEIIGSLLSFIIGVLIWEWFDKTERGKEIALLNEKIQQLSNQIHSIHEKTSFVEQKININSSIFNLIKKQDDKIKDLIIHYTKSKPFVGRYYSRILGAYHNTFSIVNNGFHIKDEHLSLSSFVIFWKYLVSAQKERAATNEKCLIVRIIHSNSIHIWTNEHSKYKEFTNRLLKLQKEFSESGGKIVRIFIGAGEEPDTNYKVALQRMEENLVEGKYVKQSEHNKLPYDFLLLHDEDFVLKWYSDAVGISLSGTLIQDFVENEVRENWDDLFEELKRANDPITSIPPDREFKVRKQ